MSIKSIVKSWYREIFWMSVGAGIALGVNKVVRTLVEKKAQKEAEAEADKNMESLVHEWDFIKEMLDREEADAAEQELEVEQSEEVTDAPAETGVDGFVPDPNLNIKGVREISEDEFCYMMDGPDIYNRFDLVYDHTMNMFGYEDCPEEDIMTDDLELRDMLGKDTIEYLISRLMAGSGGFACLSIKDGDSFIRIHLGFLEETK